MNQARRQKIVERAARKHGIPARVLWGVYGAESNFGRNKNTSSAGAQGPFQFMLATARSYGIDPHNFSQAADAAAKYLSKFKGRGLRGMLSAYNAGPAGNPNNPETRAYVPKVRELGRTWEGGRGGAGGSTGADVDYKPGSVKLWKETTFDQAGYDKARRRALLGTFLQKRGSAGSLFRTGLLTTEAPDKAEFTDTRLRSKVKPGSLSISEGGGKNGEVRFAPGADRPGMKTKPGTVRFVRKVAGVYGGIIVVGTGTRHSRLTVNGNVSDHWSGNAVDIPATGAKLMRIGRAALIAAGMNPKKARRAKGGLYNVNGHQIIFATNQGGNHHNHVHVN